MTGNDFLQRVVDSDHDTHGAGLAVDGIRKSHELSLPLRDQVITHVQPHGGYETGKGG